MDLATVWFLLIAFFWAGYLVLEGFDFGVGMILPFVAKSPEERGLATSTFGPVWDGNEVWVIVAGASMFAAFPAWYAGMFHSMYLPLTLLLVALIVRVLSIEWRGKVEDPRWRRRWDITLVVTSYLAPFAVAVALANVVRGIPLDANQDYAGSLWDLFPGYALAGAAAVLAIFALHGATFLGLRATGTVRDRAQRFAIGVWPLTTVLAGGFGVWTLLGTGGYDGGTSPVAIAALAVAAGALLVAGVAVARRREAVAFGATVVTILGVGVMLFAQLWPNVLPSTGDVAGTISIANGSSSPYTLKVMTWVAVTIVPVVLLYQGWSYWVFRHRIQEDGFVKAKSPLQALEQRRAAEDQTG